MKIENIPPIIIGQGDNELRVYGFQGGMGVKISGKRLAAACMKADFLGVIASVGLGVADGRFQREIKENEGRLIDASSDERKRIIEDMYVRCNVASLVDEIQGARDLSKDEHGKSYGALGVNVMCALREKEILFRTALERGVEAIVSGAGIPKNLPELKLEYGITDTKLIPIVASAGYASLICRLWEKKYNYYPDAIVVEGPQAGGHLGYTKEELSNPEFVRNGLERIVREVIETLKLFEQRAGRKIPVVCGGGIFYGGDIRQAVEEWKAAGAQMATRFVCTDECDADSRFKKAYINCKCPEEIALIDSPVGMPGRAITNQFLREVQEGKKHPLGCIYRCLDPCNKPEDIDNPPSYCIARALIEAQRGNLQNGFAFAGSKAYLCDEIIPVEELVKYLDIEYAQNKRSS
ncbi:nitronate monooxygenase [Candidatus Pacearchaeota archaeon]|nr:hypothetical protein [uncultured archaeon]MBS3078834.1 nitronate monooxygenase [Candidatus Pacearchaeota archaeon]